MSNYLCIANMAFKYITVQQISIRLINFVMHLTIVGTQISAAKMVLFAWTSWKISGARHLLWRLHYFPCKHFFLLLSLMILKMLLWHSRSDSFLWTASSHMLRVELTKTVHLRMSCLSKFLLDQLLLAVHIFIDYVILFKPVCIYGQCSIWKTIRHLSILLATGQKVLPRHHLVGLKIR